MLTPDASFYSLNSCCTKKNFLGSSRTYVYLATNFNGTSKEIVTPTTIGKESRCISTSSYAYGGFDRSYKSNNISKVNTINIKKSNNFGDYEISHLAGSLGWQDRFEAIYDNLWISKSAGHSSGGVVGWRDDGIIRGILSPLFLAGWMNCFGQPCYPCKMVDGLFCKGDNGKGGLENFLNDMGSSMDEYWSDNNYLPWEGFLQDWYGIIYRRAEPLTGWMIYLLFLGQFCAPCGYYDEYCGCCYFCILKNCVEPMFTVRLYGGSVLTLNKRRGIPFLQKDKILNFKSSLDEKFNYGNLDIKLDHLADEYVFFEGLANWVSGDISFVRSNRPAINLSGYIGTDNSGEASFVSGSGTFFLTDLSDDYPVIGRSGTQGFALFNMAVKHKNEINFSGEMNYPWLHVDIPEPVSLEKSYVSFSFDCGNLPGYVYGLDIPSNPWSPNYYYDQQRTLFVRSKKSDGGFRTYVSAVGIPTPTGGFDDVMLFYYKRYIKKIIKAPYNLYVKSGESYFRECKLGQTLKDLVPGRYYFPNPAYVNRQMGGIDPDFDDLLKLGLVDDTEEDFPLYFNTVYRQFIVPPGKFTSFSSLLLDIEKNKYNPVVRYSNAVYLIGSPLSGSASIEFGGAFTYNEDTFDSQEYQRYLNQTANLSSALESFFTIPR